MVYSRWKTSKFNDLKVDEKDDDPKVDERVGGRYEVSLLVNHKHEGGQDARLSRTKYNKLLWVKILDCLHSVLLIPRCAS